MIKPNKISVRPAKTLISLPCVLSGYDPNFLHADNQDSDKTKLMSGLVRVFLGYTATLYHLMLLFGTKNCLADKNMTPAFSNR